MGSHGGDGYGSSSGNAGALNDNVGALAKDFPLSKNGYFGSAGKNNPTRVIISNDPHSTAKSFWKKLSKGGDSSTTANGHQKVAFGDSSIAIFRPTTSTPNSPSIKIINKNPANGLTAVQNIHFVSSKGGKNK